MLCCTQNFNLTPQNSTISIPPDKFQSHPANFNPTQQISIPPRNRFIFRGSIKFQLVFICTPPRLFRPSFGPNSHLARKETEPEDTTLTPYMQAWLEIKIRFCLYNYTTGGHSGSNMLKRWMTRIIVDREPPLRWSRHAVPWRFMQRSKSPRAVHLTLSFRVCYG